MKRSVAAHPSNRWRSTSQRSIGASPPTTHSAIALPTPAEDMMPVVLKPAATNSDRIPGASPTMWRASTVKLSGPFKN